MITILLPTLNEEIGVKATFEMVNVAAFEAMGESVEFLIVDGNSKDKTREVAASMGVRVVVDERKGYGRAYKTGMREAKGDIIVTGDADGTYPFDTVHEAVAAFKSTGDDFHTLNRYAELEAGAMSFKHKLGNWILSTHLRLLFWVPVKDSQSGMWIIKKSALDELAIETLPDGMPFSQRIKLQAFRNKRVKSSEVPGKLRPRVGDVVLESWRDGFRNLMDIYKARFGR